MKVAGLIFPLLLSFHASAELVDKTVAIVGTKVILKSDVDEVLAHPMSGVKTREDALAALIDKDVIQEDCKQSGNYPSDSEIKQTISEVKKQNHFDDATFSAALQRSGTKRTRGVNNRLPKRRFIGGFGEVSRISETARTGERR